MSYSSICTSSSHNNGMEGEGHGFKIDQVLVYKKEKKRKQHAYFLGLNVQTDSLYNDNK